MRAEVLKAIEELGRTDVKSMDHFHHLGYAGNMKIAILELLICNDNLQYDKTTLQRELDGEYGQLERTCDLVDKVRGNVDVLLQTEKSLLTDNHIVNCSISALTKEKMELKKIVTAGIDDPVRSEDDKVDLLEPARPRVSQGSRIPKSRSQQKNAKSGLGQNGAASATQLNAIREDKDGKNDEKIIPLTEKLKAKSACSLLSESIECTAAEAKYPSESPRVRFSTSESDDVQTTHLQKPPVEGPWTKVSAPVLLTYSSDVIDDVPIIQIDEESGNFNGDDKPSIHHQKQKPATDFSMFLGGKKSAPRKEMFAEKPQEKRSLMSPLRNFFGVQKADRVEEIGEMPKKKNKPDQPRRSKTPVFRREKKKSKPDEPNGLDIPLFRRPRIFRRRKILPMPEQE